MEKSQFSSVLFLEDIINKTESFPVDSDSSRFSNMLVSFEKALKYGYVLSAPEILLLKMYSNNRALWSEQFTALSEEIVGIDNGTFYEEGTPIVVVLHGTELFLDVAKNFGKENVVIVDDMYVSLKYPDEIFYSLLEGKVLDEKIPLYKIEDFKKGVLYLPRKYGVVMSLEEASKSMDAFETIYNYEVLADNFLMIARSGGILNKYIRTQDYESLISKFVLDKNKVENFFPQYIGQINPYYASLDLTFPFGLPLMVGDYSCLFFTPVGVDANYISVKK